MAKNSPNTCEILSKSADVGDFREKFVCANDALHENMQQHPEVLVLYVLMVIFIMVFLKLVTRKRPGEDQVMMTKSDD